VAGDAGVSLWLTTSADRFGRKRTLIVSADTHVGTQALFFILSKMSCPLWLPPSVGVISPSGNEIGPFLSVEQAALTQLLPDEKRTQTFAWYNLVGSFATAPGRCPVAGWQYFCRIAVYQLWIPTGLFLQVMRSADYYWSTLPYAFECC